MGGGVFRGQIWVKPGSQLLSALLRTPVSTDGWRCAWSPWWLPSPCRDGSHRCSRLAQLEAITCHHLIAVFWVKRPTPHPRYILLLENGSHKVSPGPPFR